MYVLFCQTVLHARADVARVGVADFIDQPAAAPALHNLEYLRRRISGAHLVDDLGAEVAVLGQQIGSYDLGRQIIIFFQPQDF